MSSSSSSSSSSRPSVIRTNCSFDGNDETFSIVALNLLSRFTYFGSTPADAICDTLETPRERSCFLEALSVRKMYSNQRHHHLSPSTVSLIQTVDDNFGKDLLRIVEMEGGPSVMTYTCFGNTNTTNSATADQPTATTTTTMQNHRQQGSCQRYPAPWRGAEDRRSSKNNSKKGTASSGKRVRTFFFPDATAGLFGVTKTKTTTRNIDWKLADAIEQVSSLRLDGMNTSPTATESTISSSSLTYEPPPLPPMEQGHLQGDQLNKMF